MALVTKITKISDGYSSRIPTKCEAEYNDFTQNGEKYVRIQTFGSRERQDAGKQSQCLHINKDIAIELVRLLKNSFEI